MYEITLKYQDWFYAARLQRPDLFTALGTVLDSHEHTAVQWYRVRPLAADKGAREPAEQAVEANSKEGLYPFFIEPVRSTGRQ